MGKIARDIPSLRRSRRGAPLRRLGISGGALRTGGAQRTCESSSAGEDSDEDSGLRDEENEKNAQNTGDRPSAVVAPRETPPVTTAPPAAVPTPGGAGVGTELRCALFLVLLTCRLIRAPRWYLAHFVLRPRRPPFRPCVTPAHPAVLFLRMMRVPKAAAPTLMCPLNHARWQISARNFHPKRSWRRASATSTT